MQNGLQCLLPGYMRASGVKRTAYAYWQDLMALRRRQDSSGPSRLNIDVDSSEPIVVPAFFSFHRSSFVFVSSEFLPFPFPSPFSSVSSVFIRQASRTPPPDPWRGRPLSVRPAHTDAQIPHRRHAASREVR
uniref:Uncharacterized protein n=1 Tax=Pseudictyota dubia TaxID=2749911 RepID=A0A7R9VMY9_9STRA